MMKNPALLKEYLEILLKELYTLQYMWKFQVASDCQIFRDQTVDISGLFVRVQCLRNSGSKGT